MELGVLPTHESIVDCSDLVLDYMFQVIEHKKKTMLRDIERMLGVRFSREDLAHVNTGQKAIETDEVFVPLSFVFRPQLGEELKKLMGSTGKASTYNSSLIGGKRVQKQEGLEIVEVDERFTKEQADRLFGEAYKTAKPLGDMDPAQLKNAPTSSLDSGRPTLNDLLERSKERGRS